MCVKVKIKDVGILFVVFEFEVLVVWMVVVLLVIYVVYGIGWEDVLGVDVK